MKIEKIECVRVRKVQAGTRVADTKLVAAVEQVVRLIAVYTTSIAAAVNVGTSLEG